MAKRNTKPKLKISMIDSELAKREGGKIEDTIGNVREIRKNLLCILGDGRVKGTRYSPLEIFTVLIIGAQKLAAKKARKK